MATMRAERFWPLCCVGLLVAACGDTRILSGSFRSDAFVALEDLVSSDALESQGSPTFPVLAAFKNLSLEIVLAHFGPEVAGLAKFRKLVGSGKCPCVHIRNGRYSGGYLSFELTAQFSEECAPDLGQIDLKARLAMRDPDTLYGLENGYVEVTVAGAQVSEKMGVVLGRDKIWDDLSRQDLFCEELGQ